MWWTLKGGSNKDSILKCVFSLRKKEIRKRSTAFCKKDIIYS